jgi:hypothetical protein
VSDYPWYTVVSGDLIEQGDILRSCPIIIPPEDLADDWPPESATLDWKESDVVVMTQSCDLVKSREKVSEVLLCPLYGLSRQTGHLATEKGKEDARRGNLPNCHMLNECTIAGHETEVHIVEFRRVHVLPLPFLRRFAMSRGDRLRLMPPYREHLSQAFARFFMRVGLPTDIKPFVKPK